MLMEEFKNSLSERVATYSNENKVVDVSTAAVLVDEYVLTHKFIFVERPFGFGFGKKEQANGDTRDAVRNGSPSSEPVTDFVSGKVEIKSNTTETKAKDNVMCFYCRKKGHIIANCQVLTNKNVKPVVLIKTVSQGNESLLPDKACEYADFKPFVMDGFVSVAGCSNEIPVKILRDTAASQSLILEGFLPLNNKTAVGFNVPVRGFNLQDIGVPLHKIALRSDLWSGDAVVGVRPGFPISGVSFIMGNDLAENKVLITSEVTPVPIVSYSPDKLAQNYPDVFTSYAVTRAASKHQSELINEDIDLSDTFLSGAGFNAEMLCETKAKMTSGDSASDSEHVTMSRQDLVKEQKKDVTLSALFENLVSDIQNVSTGYFLSDHILMRKWLPRHVSVRDEWCSVTQIVVPMSYRKQILSLAHDNPFSSPRPHFEAFFLARLKERCGKLY